MTLDWNEIAIAEGPESRPICVRYRCYSGENQFPRAAFSPHESCS